MLSKNGTVVVTYLCSIMYTRILVERINFKNPEKQVVLFHVDPVGYKNTAAVHDAEHIVFSLFFGKKALIWPFLRL